MAGETTYNTFLLAQDTINGKEGFATIVQDGTVSTLFNAEKIMLDANLDTTKIKVVGSRVTQTKITGVEFAGTMSVFYGTDTFFALLRQYVLTGVMPYFDLNVTNNDPASNAGVQAVTIQNCLITSKVTLAMLDAAADALKMDLSYSATGLILNNAFTAPSVFGTSQSTPADTPMNFPG